MVEKILFNLNENWRVGQDDLQWMLQKKEGDSWNPKAYIRGHKDALMVVIRENSVGNITDEARRELGKLRSKCTKAE